MRRHSDLHQSAAISAVLLVLLFALPPGGGSALSDRAFLR